MVEQYYAFEVLSKKNFNYVVIKNRRNNQIYPGIFHNFIYITFTFQHCIHDPITSFSIVVSIKNQVNRLISNVL